MSIDELIKIADKAYPDGLVARAHKGEDVGDPLALFVVRELKDTYYYSHTTQEQLQHAANAIRRAAKELNAVYDAFQEERSKSLGKLRAEGS